MRSSASISRVRWLWYVAPPAAIVLMYRMIPSSVRRLWSLGSSTSGPALLTILSGGGWKSFFRLATPRFRPSLGWKSPSPNVYR